MGWDEVSRMVGTRLGTTDGLIVVDGTGILVVGDVDGPVVTDDDDGVVMERTGTAVPRMVGIAVDVGAVRARTGARVVRGRGRVVDTGDARDGRGRTTNSTGGLLSRTRVGTGMGARVRRRRGRCCIVSLDCAAKTRGRVVTLVIIAVTMGRVMVMPPSKCGGVRAARFIRMDDLVRGYMDMAELLE